MYSTSFIPSVPTTIIFVSIVSVYIQYPFGICTRQVSIYLPQPKKAKKSTDQLSDLMQQKSMAQISIFNRLIIRTNANLCKPNT